VTPEERLVRLETQMADQREDMTAAKQFQKPVHGVSFLTRE